MIEWKRWLPGMPDDDTEDPVAKTLRTLQQGATDIGAGISQGAQDLGSGLSSAASSAGTALGSAATTASSYLPDIGANMAQNRQAVEDANQGRSGGVDFGAGIAVSPPGQVYGGALAQANRTEDEIAARNREADPLSLVRAATDVLEPVHRGLAQAHALVGATPAAAYETANALGAPVGLGREGPLGVDLPVLGRVGPTDVALTLAPVKPLQAALNLPYGTHLPAEAGPAASRLTGALEEAGSAVAEPVRAALGTLREAAGGAVEGVGRALGAPASREAAPAEGEMLLGSGVVPTPEPRRMYHGTAEAFGRPEPGKFDADGLFGPGYYLTSDPRVASSYASSRNFTPGGITPKPVLRASRLQQEVDSADHFLANPRLGADDRAFYEGQRTRAAAELERVTSQGPNVRAIDVPAFRPGEPGYEPGSAPKLFDLDATGVGSDAYDVIDRETRWLGLKPLVNVGPNSTGMEVYDALLDRFVDATGSVKQGKTAVNEMLHRIGWDGLSHQGGRLVPIMDEAGNPIQHDVNIIFGSSLDKIRNAFSGEAGGSGLVPRLGAGAYNAAQGAVLGAASEDLQAQQEGREPDPTQRLLRGGMGAGLGYLAGRHMPAAGERALGSGFVPRIRATPEQIAAEAKLGAARGSALNRAVVPPPSEVPLGARIAVEATDDRAGVRWAEDMLTEAAGRPRMRESDPARPSTLSRENAASIGNERVRSELEPAVISAGKAGLHDELPQHLEDMQQRDILAEFYRRGRQEALDAAEPGLQRMRAKGATADELAAAQQRIADGADLQGVRRMRQRQGRNPDMAWEALDARLTAQEQRLKSSGQWDQLQDSAQQVWDHNATTRQRAHAAGEIDTDTLAYLEETYPHYVPTVPLSHLDARGGPTAASSAGINRGRAPLVRSLEDVGTSGERLNPIAASRGATLRAERSMQKNRTTRAFAQLYDEALEAAPGDLAAPSGKKSLLAGDTEVSYIENGQPTTIRVPKIVADGLEAAAGMGADPDVLRRAQRAVMSTVTSAMTAARASFLPVNVVRDMQDYAVRTATLEGGGAQRIPGIMGDWLSEAGKAASDIALAQLNPRGAVGAATGFAAGAAAGDENTTLAERLKHGAEGAVAGTFLVGANRVRPTRAAREFLARGGGAGGASTGWQASQRWLRDVQRQGGAPIRSVGDAARAFGDWMGDVATLQGIKGINERGELISRTAAMNRAERVRGLGPTEAMIAGRDVTYDPDRAGRVARAVNGVVPFFNATTQSGAQFVRLLRQNPVAATATMVTTVAPVVAAAEAWNRSDPERARVYDDVPDYVKNAGLVVVTPWAGSDTRGERPEYLWIPTGIITPFVIGMRESMRNVPGLEPRAESATPDSDAARWAGTLNDVLQVFNPVRGDSAGSLLSNLVPPIVKQGVELAQNRDLYRGTPIMSDVADERASAASRAVASGAQAVGRVVGSDFLQEVRPSGVEHIVRSLPAYGDIVTGASDLVAPSGYKRAEDRPIVNEPFVGGIGARFVRDTGGENLQRAEEGRLGPGVRAVLEEAGLPPSTIGTVGSRYQNGPLTRDEQLAWQEATNAEAERYVQEARRDPRWRTPATQQDAIADAIRKARDAGAKQARLPGSAEIQRRIRDEDRLRRAG